LTMSTAVVKALKTLRIALAVMLIILIVLAGVGLYCVVVFKDYSVVLAGLSLVGYLVFFVLLTYAFLGVSAVFPALMLFVSLLSTLAVMAGFMGGLCPVTTAVVSLGGFVASLFGFALVLTSFREG